MDPECDFAVDAFEGSRVGRRGRPKSGVDVHLVEVTHRPLVFLEVTLRPEKIIILVH